MPPNPVEVAPPEKASAANYADVVIIGAGPGGLATAILLARANRKVVCIDAESFPRERVGESLDWSTPALLRMLGLASELLVEQRVGTHKRKIKVEPVGEPVFGAQPDEYKFLSKRPFEFEVLTLHVDRTQMDMRLLRTAQDLGVSFVWDRITRVETAGDRVVACWTGQNGQFKGRWFIDASGRAQLFARTLRIPKTEYGRPKTCLWTYFKSPCVYDGTTFFTDGRAEYLSWIWEIPITPDTVSVGYVVSAEEFRQLRLPKRSVKDVLLGAMARFPRLERLTVERPDFGVRTCSWRCYVQRRVSGLNWLMVGESAALPDPLTSNGVTAAFRHAQQAADVLLEAETAGTLPRRQRGAYETNVRRMGNIYNYCIERVIYDPPVRRGLSTDAALRVYAHFGYLINALFTKFQPRRAPGLFLFGLLLLGVRVWMETWVVIGKLGTLLCRFRHWRRLSGSTPLSAPKGTPQAF